MEDIAISLSNKIKSEFNAEIAKSKKVAKIQNAIKTKTATYKDAYSAANEIGNIRAKILKRTLNSEVLPDGKMYFNIANRVVRESLETDHEIISQICTNVQKISNAKNGIGLKVIEPPIDEDRIMGFINRISSENIYDDIAWILEEPLKTFDRKTVDDSVQKNAEFQYKAGLKARVIRQADAKCCDWCNELAGIYIYPNVPSEVFMRHDNCKCSLEYSGEKLTAYSRNFM